MSNTNVIRICGTLALMTTFAERMKQRRLALGLTQQQLATSCGLAQSAIGNMESGSRQGSRHIGILSAALGVNPVWLETGKGEIEPLSDTARKIAQAFNQLSPERQKALAAIIEAAIGLSVSSDEVEAKMPITRTALHATEPKSSYKKK